MEFKRFYNVDPSKNESIILQEEYVESDGYMLTNESKYRHIDTRSGYSKLMCESCGYMIPAYIKTRNFIDITPLGLNPSSSIPAEIEVVPSTSIFINKCPNCGLEDPEFFLIDYNMSGLIELLNKYGFYTRFCCESHEEKYSNMYIMFDNNKIMDYLDFLPDTWEFDLRAFKLRNQCMIYVPNIYHDISEYYKHKEEYLNDLSMFVIDVIYPKNLQRGIYGRIIY